MQPNQSQKPNWAYYFNIDDATWASLCAQAEEKHVSTLDLALDSGLLNENKLLEWDRNQSGLPSLKDVFFNGEPPRELWKKCDFNDCRKHACLPIAEWDGIVYWAQVSSFQNHPPSAPATVAWVLAPWSGLKRWFEIWQRELPKAAAPIPVVPKNVAHMFEMPSSPSIPTPQPVATTPVEAPIPHQPEKEFSVNTSTATNVDGFSLEEFKPEVAEPALIQAQEEERLTPPEEPTAAPEFSAETPTEFAAPLGLSTQDTGTDKFDLDFSSVGLDDGSHHAAPAMTPMTVEKPNAIEESPVSEVSLVNIDTMEFSLEAAPETTQAAAPKKAGPPGAVQTQAPPAAPKAEDFFEIDAPAEDFLKPISLDGPGAVPQNITAPPSLENMPPIPNELPPVTEQANVQLGQVPQSGGEIYRRGWTPASGAPPLPGTQQPPVMPPAQGPIVAQAIQTPISMASMAQGPITTVPLDKLEESLKAGNSQDAIANSLLGAWQNYFGQVMILLLQQEKLVIWWRNDKWKGNFAKGETINLDTPSIFKIVADTGHPYHGYISPGSINDTFFKVTNQGQYPEHVTVVPVLTANRVVAMLLGTCTKDAGRTIPLEKLEGHATLFALGLMRVALPHQKAG